MDLLRLPETDPLKIYRYRDGLFGVEMLITAVVHFDFFTWLATQPGTKAQICQHFGLADRPVDTMLTFLTALNLICAENGVFEVTALAREHLVKGSQWYLGPYYASLADRPVCKDLVQVLKTDKAANWGSVKTAKEWATAMQEPNFAESFTAAMDCRGTYLGAAMAKQLDLTGRSRMLDIAGGSGIYSCATVAHHPHIKATVLERPPVNEIAQQHLNKRGFADRVSVVAVEMFTEAWPTGYDVHLISNVLHDWDFPKVRPLLAKSFAALEPGGLLVIHDAFINAEKTGPLAVAEYSVLLMHSTEGKCYSTTEMSGLLTEAGFRDFKYSDTAVDRGIMTAHKPR